MNKIKFRAWDKNDKKIHQVSRLDFGRDNTLYVQYEDNCDKLFMITGNIELMQYTNSKDRIGREIYDGDLVIWDGQSEPVEVYWQNNCWYPTFNITTEVVGNKYEKE